MTDAGRRLLAEADDMDWPGLPDLIAAIEAEARAEERAARERVEAALDEFEAKLAGSGLGWEAAIVVCDEFRAALATPGGTHE